MDKTNAVVESAGPHQMQEFHCTDCSKDEDSLVMYKTIFELDNGERREETVVADNEQDAESIGRLRVVAGNPTRNVKTIGVEEL